MADTSLARRALTGAGWLIGWRMVSRTLGFLSTLVLARLLLPADFGLVAMATTFSGAIDSLSQFSVEDMLVRRVEDDTSLHDAAFTLQVMRAILTGGLIAAGAPFAAEWFHEPRLVPVLLVLGALSAVAGFENIGLVAFRRQLRFDVQFRLSLVPRLLQVLTTVGIAWEWRSYWALLAGMAVTRLARLVMTYVVHPYRPRFGLGGWRELAGFSGWLWAASLARLVWDRYDSFLIGPAFGAASLGLFQIAQTVALLPISELVAPASDVLLAGLSAGQREGNEAVRRTESLALAAALIVAPLGLAVSTGSREIVRIMLGPDIRWIAAVPLISAFALICLVSPIGYVTRSALIASGHVRREFWATMVSSITKVCLISWAVQTGRLQTVAWTIVALAAGEASLFLIFCALSNLIRVRLLLGGAFRIVIGLLLGAGIMRVASSQFTTIPTGAEGLAIAFAHLTVRSISAAVGVAAGTFGAWVVASCPEGPESVFLRAIKPIVGRMRARWTQK
jgi:lipopolysaccharide exporter